jgi:hypothetical protein
MYRDRCLIKISRVSSISKGIYLVKNVFRKSIHLEKRSVFILGRTMSGMIKSHRRMKIESNRIEPWGGGQGPLYFALGPNYYDMTTKNSRLHTSHRARRPRCAHRCKQGLPRRVGDGSLRIHYRERSVLEGVLSIQGQSSISWGIHGAVIRGNMDTLIWSYAM